jgi:hypothetical protein
MPECGWSLLAFQGMTHTRTMILMTEPAVSPYPTPREIKLCLPQHSLLPLQPEIILTTSGAVARA